MTFGADTLSADGASAWLVAAMDGAGATPAWARRFVGAGIVPGDVAADGDGVVATARWTGTLDLGDGPIAPVGDTATAIAAFDADGTLRWTRALLPLVAGAEVLPWDIAVRGDTVVVVGIFWRSVDLLGETVASQGEHGNDAFVIALDRATGAVRWRRAFHNAGHNDAEAVAVLAGGDVVVAGQHVSPIDLGGGPRRAGTQEDAWIARLDGDTGAHVWSHSVGTAAEEYGKGLAIGPGDAVVLQIGVDGNAATLDLGDGVSATTTTEFGAVVARWTADGAPVWATFVEWLGGTRGQPSAGARLWLVDRRPLAVALDVATGAIVLDRRPASASYLFPTSAAVVDGALLVAGPGFAAHDLDGLASTDPTGGFVARLGVTTP